MTVKTFAAAFLAATFLTACASTPDNPFSDPVGERMVELADNYQDAERKLEKAQDELKDAQKDERKARKKRDEAQDELKEAVRDLDDATEALNADRLLMAETGGVSPDQKRSDKLADAVKDARKDVEDAREDIRKAGRDIDRAQDKQRKAKARMKDAQSDMDAATKAYRKGS